MRKRRKLTIKQKIVNRFNRIKFFFINIRNAQENAFAQHSAQYILDGFDNKEGIEKLAEFTGLPEGVIDAAIENIFKQKKRGLVQKMKCKAFPFPNL